ncbi:MAG: hypothetical protein QM579_00820 [Desulfovibrio sp.]
MKFKPLWRSVCTPVYGSSHWRYCESGAASTLPCRITAQWQSQSDYAAAA